MAEHRSVESSASIRRQLLLMLYFNHLYKALARSIENGAQNRADSSGHNRNLNNKDDDDDDDGECDYYHLRSCSGRRVILPKLHWSLRAYDWLSTSVHTISFSLILALKLSLIDRQGTLRCQYMPSLAVHKSISQNLILTISCWISAYQLACRMVMTLTTGNSLTLDTICFLLLGDDEIYRAATSGEIATGRPPRKLIICTPPPSAAGQSRPLNGSQMRPIERLSFVEAILYYRLRDKLDSEKVRFTLRPNRTIGARLILVKILNFCSRQLFVGYAMMFFATLPLVLYLIFLDHQSLYPECNLAPIDSLTALTHFPYWTRAFSSFLVAIVLFIDTMGLLWFTGLLMMLLIYDLYARWLPVQSDLNLMFKQLARLEVIKADLFLRSSRIHNYGPTTTSMTTNGALKRTAECCSWFPVSSFAADRPLPSSGGGAAVAAAATMAIAHLRERRYIQHHVDQNFDSFLSGFVDFTRQLRQTDEIISRLIFLGLYLWLSLNLAVTLEGIQTTNSTKISLIRFIQIIGILVYCFGYYYILLIKGFTEMAHIQICSMVAWDPSRDKRRWLSLLAFYSGPKKLHGFTMWPSGQLFTALACSKILSYTLSLAFLYESYRNQWSSYKKGPAIATPAI